MSEGYQPTGPPPMPPVKPARRDEADQIERLIQALHAQTAAMQDLADSNRAVVDLVIAQQAEPEDDDSAPPTYLDGIPREL